MCERGLQRQKRKCPLVACIFRFVFSFRKMIAPTGLTNRRADLIGTFRIMTRLYGGTNRQHRRMFPTGKSTCASIAGRRRPLCPHLASPSSAAKRLLSCQTKTPNFRFLSGFGRSGRNLIIFRWNRIIAIINSLSQFLSFRISVVFVHKWEG